MDLGASGLTAVTPLLVPRFQPLVCVSGNLAALAKEMADLLYVVYGTAVSYGIDMDPVFREVHRSNLSKVGGYKRADGKWVKPPTYSPADIEPLLAMQMSAPEEAQKPLGGVEEMLRGA